MITDNPNPEYHECYYYDLEGDNYSRAWDIMREAMQAPPSLEVFQEGMGDSTPEDYAEYLVSKKV